MDTPVNSSKRAFGSTPGDNAFEIETPLLSQGLTSKHSELELKFLSAIFENTHHCIRPTPQKYPDSKWANRPSSLYISTISLSLRYIKGDPHRSHYEFVNNTPWSHLTYSDQISIRDFEELVVEGILSSLREIREDDDAGDATKLLLINEFGFPFFRQDEPREKFISKIQSLAQHNKAYILCGTSHCFRQKKNVAIFSQPSVPAAVEHHKFSPSMNLGEILKPRDSLDWIFYKNSLGRVAVLICFDVVDPNVLLRQIYLSRDLEPANRIDMYLIPTFSPNDLVREQAQILSHLTNSTVVYCNAQYFDPRNPQDAPIHSAPLKEAHGVFLSGDDVTTACRKDDSDFSDLITHLPERVFCSKTSGQEFWASINTIRLAYRSTIERIRGKDAGLSPLMEEILSLIKPPRKSRSRGQE